MVLRTIKMGRVISLMGQKFYRWTVLARTVNDKYNKAMWECICDCGTVRTVLGCNLMNGSSKSCGCYKSEAVSRSKKKGLVGKKFGRLKVIREYGKNSYNNYL